MICAAVRPSVRCMGRATTNKSFPDWELSRQKAHVYYPHGSFAITDVEHALQSRAPRFSFPDVCSSKSTESMCQVGAAVVYMTGRSCQVVACFQSRHEKNIVLTDFASHTIKHQSAAPQRHIHETRDSKVAELWIKNGFVVLVETTGRLFHSVLREEGSFVLLPWFTTLKFHHSWQVTAFAKS